MKPNDLRVGNYILDEGKRVVRITGIFEYGAVWINDNKKPLNILFAIKLDELILDACDLRHTRTSIVDHLSYGFSTTTKEYGLFDDELNEYFKVTITTNSKDGRMSINCSNKSNIQYLHELQNAYWWANGEEMPFDFNVYAKFFA
jgi:hypothetical protein